MTAPVPEITPEELVAAVERGDAVHVLDVRAPHRLANGRIDIVPPERFHNVKGSTILALEDPHESGLDPEWSLAVVCGLGNDSRTVAAHLNGRGFRAASVRGGIAAWMDAVVARELDSPPELDHLVQFDRIGKGALGYLLVSAGEAVIVDAPRRTDPYLAAAGRARVVAVADTHAHADYISGGPALGASLGVPYHLHPADAVYPYDGRPGKVRFEAVEEGSRIRFGRAALDVVHTPGHTEGSVSYRLGDRLVLTGDFVFVDSVGRPDLGGKTEEWTRVLWRTIVRARREWPESMRVLPAHYASDRERNRDRSVGAPLGEVLARNGPLAMATEEEFAAWIAARAGSFPDAYRRIKAVNVGLEIVNDSAASELEAGRNQCALG
jgi:glyoxylase-like metal-dependent hydrolase (beta-lactamase superfamily II)